jgi:hypothetical protein
MAAQKWKSQVYRRIRPFLPSRFLLAHEYRLINGVTPDLRNPKLFSEKILHRVLHDRDPLLHTFCDKIAAKEWIAARIGPGHTPRTLAVASSVAELEGFQLPDRWMLKASHGSGWYQLVAPPSHPLDAAVRAEAERWLKSDYADTYLEWGYRGLPRRLIAEELLTCDGGQCREASAFCFRGKVEAMRINVVSSALIPHRSSQRTRPRTKECFLDGQLQVLPLERHQFEHDRGLADTDRDLLGVFVSMASELSKDTPFLRVDVYISDGGVRIGELTCYPGAGIFFQMPRQWDAWLGAFWI